MKTLDLLQALLVVTIWGLNFVSAKIGTAQLPPFCFTAIRFFLAGILLVPFVAFPKGMMLRILGLSSVLGVAHFGMMFLGISGLDVGSAAIALQLSVPFSAAIGAVVYKEKMGRDGLLGLILAMGGVMLVAGAPQHPDPLYLGFVISAAFAWAISNLLIKRLGKFDHNAVNGWVSLFAAPQLALLSLLLEHDQIAAIQNTNWMGWSAMAYTTIGSSIIAYSIWYRLIARLSFTQLVPITLLNPVIGIAAGALMLGDPLGWRKIAGGLATLIGVAIIVLRKTPPMDNPVE